MEGIGQFELVYRMTSKQFCMVSVFILSAAYNANVQEFVV